MRQPPLLEPWQEVAQRMESITDRFGQPIDQGIFELVVALTALGVKTTSSCEGHLDHGYASPWIAFQASTMQAMQQQVQAVTMQLQHAKNEQQPEAIIAELESQMFRFAQEARIGCFQELLQVHQALEAFYGTRQVSYDQQLYLHSDSFGHSQLQNHGMDYQLLRPFEVRSARLVMYQQEMQIFAAFLKTDYLVRPSTSVATPSPLNLTLS